MFVNRAQRKSLAFDLTAENAEAVAGICRELDGIPHAIVLAAALVGGMAIRGILESLTQSFQLLTKGSHGNHETLEATIDWSYGLLNTDEKNLLLRLAVFKGEWDLQAATNVCSGSGIEARDIERLLVDLVDMSLVEARRVPNEDMRYRLLKTTQKYCLNRFKASVISLPVLGQQHLDYFLARRRQTNQAPRAGPT